VIPQFWHPALNEALLRLFPGNALNRPDELSQRDARTPGGLLQCSNESILTGIRAAE
jgi:hypothetical protein